ncbi:hypothetical protein COC69_12330 [Bacillus cereus]|uniref:Uncharacterized protein n=2 Tax=Bacillus cereus TaxID=1396 RepID=A0A9X7CNV5_BACCE|nr:hypothetical protein COC69_12330 [Bacillus cereus]
MKEYPEYIEQVAQQALAQISKQELGYAATNNDEYTNAMAEGARRTIAQSEGSPYPEEIKKVNQARSDLKEIQDGKKYVLPAKVAEKIYAYRANTEDNLAFNIIMSSSKGNKHTGWVQENGVSFYEKEGIRENSGWFKDGALWYYLDPTDGHAVTGWFKDKEKWYYLLPGNSQTNTEVGRMFVPVMGVNTQKIDGKIYKFDENGVCLNPNE